MSDTIDGAWFVWETGLKEWVPAIYPHGYPKSQEKKIRWKIRLTPEETQMSLHQLIERYPIGKAFSAELKALRNTSQLT